MTARKIMFSGHAIDRDKNVMELALFRNFDGSATPTCSKSIARRGRCLSTKRAGSRMATAWSPARLSFLAETVAGLAGAVAFDPRRPALTGQHGRLRWASKIVAMTASCFSTFGLDCVRLPAGKADALLNLFEILAEDLEEVQRATEPQRAIQLQVAPRTCARLSCRPASRSAGDYDDKRARLPRPAPCRADRRRTGRASRRARAACHRVRSRRRRTATTPGRSRGAIAEAKVHDSARLDRLQRRRCHERPQQVDALSPDQTRRSPGRQSRRDHRR